MLPPSQDASGNETSFTNVSFPTAAADKPKWACLTLKDMLIVFWWYYNIWQPGPMEEMLRMTRIIAPFRTRGGREVAWWRSRQTFKWILAKQAWKTGNLFILFNHWQGWWQGVSCTCYLEKGAEEDILTNFQRSLPVSWASPTSHLPHSLLLPNAREPGASWHPARSSAFQ